MPIEPDSPIVAIPAVDMAGLERCTDPESWTPNLFSVDPAPVPPKECRSSYGVLFTAYKPDGEILLHTSHTPEVRLDNVEMPPSYRDIPWHLDVEPYNDNLLQVSIRVPAMQDSIYEFEDTRNTMGGTPDAGSVRIFPSTTRIAAETRNLYLYLTEEQDEISGSFLLEEPQSRQEQLFLMANIYRGAPVPINDMALLDVMLTEDESGEWSIGIQEIW